MQVKVKKINENAKLPHYATPGAGCFDISCVNGAALNSNASHVLHTGLSFEIPEGYVMLVFSRSGHGFKHDVRLSNCVGIIDSDYRGELMIKMKSDSTFTYLDIAPGDRIAQGMILPVNQVQFVESETLSETDRGENGLGSTGVK